MKTIATNKTSNVRIIALFVLLVLSGAKMFGQEVKTEVAPIVLTNTIAAADHSESQMELVTWIMGEKQSQVSNTTTNGTISTNKTNKKQFINNGLTTNRILNRVFLKKATNNSSAIA